MEQKTRHKILTIVSFALLIVTYFTLKPLYALGTTPTPTITASVSPTPSVSTSVTPSVSTTASPTGTDRPTLPPSATPSIDPNLKLPVNQSIKVETQYPWNKQIPVTVVLTPRYDGQTLEIRWPTKTGFIITPKSYVWKNVSKDQTYSMTFTFDPTTVGRQVLSADVVLTTYATNYISSLPLEITLNGEKIVQPVTDQYRTYETGMYVGIGVVLFAVIPLSIFLGIMYIKNKLIPKWIQARLNEPI